jgi:hypothetical protein
MPEVPKPVYASGGRLRSFTAPNRADEESSVKDGSPIIVAWRHHVQQVICV